jgi:hypothetical protein
MNMNRIGMNVKKGVNSALSTLFAVMNRFKVERSSLHGNAGLAENVCSERETERILTEAEIRKAQAYVRMARAR